MAYAKYGSTFRKLREQLHLSLSSFSSIGISKATLSYFERGETMMSFDNVLLALQFMGVSLAEFERFLNNYSPSDSDSLLEEVERENIAQDVTELKKLQKLSAESGFPYISLAAKSSWSSLSEKETEKIVDLLYDTEIWEYKVVDYKLANTMFHRNLWNVTKGYWIYCFLDAEKGDEMMLKVLQTFRELANPETAIYYQTRYDLLVKNKG